MSNWLNDKRTKVLELLVGVILFVMVGMACYNEGYQKARREAIVKQAVEIERRINLERYIDKIINQDRK